MTPFMGITGLGGPTPSLIKNVSGGAVSFTFKYHMYGSTMGTMRMCWMTSDGGGGVEDGTLTLIQSPDFVANGSATSAIVGQQQTSGSQAWKDGSLDLSSFYGETGRIVFLYIKTPSGFRGDAAIDNMTLTIGEGGSAVTTEMWEVGSSTSTKWWSQSVGYDYSSVANCISTFEAGTLSWSRPTTATTSVPWVKDDENTGSPQTGPDDSARGGDGYYYLYVETSNNANTNMYNANKYCFLVSNEFTLS